MKYLLFILLAFSLNAQPFHLNDPAFLGALQPKAAVVGNGLLNGLLGYYKLDDSSGDFADSSIYNTPSVNSYSMAPTYSVTPAVINTAVQINYSGLTSTTGVKDIAGGTFSFSFWYKNTCTNGGGVIINNSQSGYLGWFVNHTLSYWADVFDENTQENVSTYFPDTTSFYVMDGSGGNDYGPTATGLDDGSWHHIVCVYDGTTSHIYKDGTEVGTPRTISSAATTDGYLFISDICPSDSSGLNVIDEVGIWNTALTQDQITLLATPTPFSTFQH